MDRHDGTDDPTPQEPGSPDDAGPQDAPPWNWDPPQGTTDEPASEPVIDFPAPSAPSEAPAGRHEPWIGLPPRPAAGPPEPPEEEPPEETPGDASDGADASEETPADASDGADAEPPAVDAEAMWSDLAGDEKAKKPKRLKRRSADPYAPARKKANRTAMVMTGAVISVALAIVAAFVLISSGDDVPVVVPTESPRQSPQESPEPEPSPEPTEPVSVPGLPVVYEGDGFRIHLPTGWTKTSEREGRFLRIGYGDGGGGRFLTVIVLGRDGEAPVSDADERWTLDRGESGYTIEERAACRPRDDACPAGDGELTVLAATAAAGGFAFEFGSWLDEDVSTAIFRRIIGSFEIT